MRHSYIYTVGQPAMVKLFQIRFRGSSANPMKFNATSMLIIVPLWLTLFATRRSATLSSLSSIRRDLAAGVSFGIGLPERALRHGN
jgi:hypothetical protein